MVEIVEIEETPMSSLPSPTTQSIELVFNSANVQAGSEDQSATLDQICLKDHLELEKEQAIPTTTPASAATRPVEPSLDRANDQTDSEDQVKWKDNPQPEREQTAPTVPEELPPSPAVLLIRSAKPGLERASDQAGSESQSRTRDQANLKDKPQELKEQAEPVDIRIARRSTQLDSVDVAYADLPDELYELAFGIQSAWIAQFRGKEMMLRTIWIALDEFCKIGLGPSRAQGIVWKFLLRMRMEGRITQDGRIAVKPAGDAGDMPRRNLVAEDPKNDMNMDGMDPRSTVPGNVGFQGAPRPNQQHLPVPVNGMIRYAVFTVPGFPPDNRGMVPVYNGFTWQMWPLPAQAPFGRKRQIESLYGPMPDNVGPDPKRMHPGHSAQLPPPTSRQAANLSLRPPTNVSRQQLPPQTSMQAGNGSVVQSKNLPPQQLRPQISVQTASLRQPTNVPPQQEKPYRPGRVLNRQHSPPALQLPHYQPYDPNTPMSLAMPPLPTRPPVQGDITFAPLGAPLVVRKPLGANHPSHKWKNIDVTKTEPGWELFNRFPELTIEEIIRDHLPDLNGGVHLYIRNVLLSRMVKDPSSEIIALIGRIHGHNGEKWGIKPEDFQKAWNMLRLREGRDDAFLHYKKFGCLRCLWRRTRCEMARTDHPGDKHCLRCGQYGLRESCRRPPPGEAPKCMPPEWTVEEF